MKQEKKSSKSLIILVVILILIILVLVGYILHDKGVFTTIVGEEDSSVEEIVEQEEQEEEQDVENSDTKDQNTINRCVGTYYGESNETNSNESTLKVTYILNEDGTFTADYNSLLYKGVYVINDNTVSFIRMKDTVGPRDEDPYYYTDDYVISDDCSYIRIASDSGYVYNINKQ